MTYTSDIPASGETLGGTRARINANFQEIATLEAVNHVAFNSAGEGKHKFLQIPEINTQTPSTIPATTADEGAIYTKVGTNPAQTNLFFRGESSGYEYQMTKAISASTGTFGTNTAYVANNNGGWTFLPGGLLLQYGRRTSPGASGGITFPVAFPSGNAPFSVIVTYEGSTAHEASISNTGISSTGFSYFASISATAVNWVAIGN